ncbi:phytanoyl-CoA hydroxylase [Colletotrichum nymphaeae SA-01]|uniref:Phytanoyl-CoA hydroxylase n=1 Tax=Colletotrichum nymphaeae SA-01 TaxID=1460502 RepID=A0A135TT25_9PEZI|nr:phytanoyl-CoA hydroxylase [Colletotrichum nymphaeae SA-01]
MPHAESPTPDAPPTINGVQLHVNDDLLSANEVEPLIQSHLTEDFDVLRQRYRQHGYLLIKNLIPREDVLSARESYFNSLAPSGVIKPGTSPREGIFDDAKSAADYPGIGAGSVKNAAPGETDRSEIFTEAALKAHTEDWYAGSEDGSVRGFCNHPVLRNFVAEFTGWGDENTLTVKRTLLRNNTPGNKAIGVHYDQSFMRYGEPTSVTAWVPIGDVRLEGGGLIYMQDGEKLGEEIENEFTTKAKAAGMSDEETKNAFNANMMSTGFLCDGPADFGRRYGKKWLVSAYEAGDVVFHSAHMIHASTKNYDPEGRIRLGTDLRFVDKRRPWDTRWDKHYSFNDGV